MRPKVSFLSDDLIETIISEAKKILSGIGIEIQNKTVVALLKNHGAKTDKSASRLYINEEIINASLDSVPGSFQLYNNKGDLTNDFSGMNVHFTPGSAALNILDYESGKMRKPETVDYINYVKIADQLKYIASQSTAMIPSDVVSEISACCNRHLQSRIFSNNERYACIDPRIRREAGGKTSCRIFLLSHFPAKME